jgi:hypothetical protein
VLWNAEVLFFCWVSEILLELLVFITQDLIVIRRGVLVIPLVIGWVPLSVWSMKESTIQSALLSSLCDNTGIWGCCGVDPML